MDELKIPIIRCLPFPTELFEKYWLGLRVFKINNPSWCVMFSYQTETKAWNTPLLDFLQSPYTEIEQVHTLLALLHPCGTSYTGGFGNGFCILSVFLPKTREKVDSKSSRFTRVRSKIWIIKLQSLGELASSEHCCKYSLLSYPHSHIIKCLQALQVARIFMTKRCQ